MIIFIQFTLTDQRSFAKIDSTILKKPAWPSPNPFKEFVRGSGQIIIRKGGGLDNWIGENYICRINKGIKIKNVEIKRIESTLKNISKHQYSSEGGILTEYEFVFQIVGKKQIVTRKIVEEIIDNLLNAETLIRNTDYTYSNTTLRKCIKDLKTFHLVTTTKGKGDVAVADQKYLDFCTPQIYIFLKRNETLDITEGEIKNLTKTSDSPFSLYTYLKNINNNPYRVWIHKEKSIETSTVELNRSLRISLLRIHAEYECLNNVFENISNGLIKVSAKTAESDKLQFYINNTISSITKQKESVEIDFGEANSIEYFKNLFYRSKPGDHETLIRKIKEFNFRPQIENKTVVYINNLEVMENKYKIDHSQVGAIGDGAKSDNNQFQQTNYTIPNNLDYDKLVVELNELKNHINSQPDLPQKEEIVKNIEDAEKEAVSKNGNGVVKYLKMGGKWIFDTATKIGISLVTELLKTNLLI
jgi:hypothetical protein